jgi:preprotein translocase subunit SecA
MSRDCRVRDNRGHDYYEMVAIMSLKNGGAGSSAKKNSAQVKRVKIGRNDPCPCGSGKKYKNCHGRPGMPPLE